jgi:micrococcal nuclease
MSRPPQRASSTARRALLLATATLACVGAAAAPAGAIELKGTVSSVVDGDTIKVISRGFETPVRLIGIDTPETRHPSEPVQCFGPAASARASRLLPVGQQVRLVSDPTQATRDRYGRFLAA